MTGIPPFLTAAANVGWTLTPLSLLVVAVVALIRSWPALRKMKVDGDTSLREDLLRRVDTLESAQSALIAELREQSEKHHHELQAQAEKHAAEMVARDEKHAIEMRQLHDDYDGKLHRLKNMLQAEGGTLDILLNSIAMSPEKAAEAAQRALEARDKRALEIATKFSRSNDRSEAKA